jgi:hypothetical protein
MSLSHKHKTQNIFQPISELITERYSGNRIGISSSDQGNADWEVIHIFTEYTRLRFLKPCFYCFIPLELHLLERLAGTKNEGLIFPSS